MPISMPLTDVAAASKAPTATRVTAQAGKNTCEAVTTAMFVSFRASRESTPVKAKGTSTYKAIMTEKLRRMANGIVLPGFFISPATSA